MVELLLGWMLLAVIPAVVAHARGLPVGTWFLYGFLLWPVAILHVFFATPESVRISGSAPPSRRCPFCAETIQAAAIVCKHCRRDLPRR
jgi:hypothetical protein